MAGEHRNLKLRGSIRRSWRSRYSSECSEILTPRSIRKNTYPQELSDQLRAVRRTVFILSSSHSPCYVQHLIYPHLKLHVAGHLDLALHATTESRGKSDNGPIEKLIMSMLGINQVEAEVYSATLLSSELNVTEVYDTLFRWMGETKVLIETVHPKDLDDLQKLEDLHNNFKDARFIWESSDPYCCKDESCLMEWYKANSTIEKFLSTKYKYSWVHVKQGDVIDNNKELAEQVTECIGVFVNRHYEKMLKCLSKFVTLNPPRTYNPSLQISDEQIVRLSKELGYCMIEP